MKRAGFTLGFVACLIVLVSLGAAWRIAGTASWLASKNIQIVVPGADYLKADYASSAPTVVQHMVEFEEDATSIYYAIPLPSELFGRRMYLDTIETKSSGTAVFGCYVESVTLYKVSPANGILTLISGEAGMTGTDVLRNISILDLPVTLEDNTLYVIKVVNQGEDGRLQTIVLNGHM